MAAVSLRRFFRSLPIYVPVISIWFSSTCSESIELFHMTSWRPYWCSKTMKQRPCWCNKKILWELNSFLMWTLSFVPINLHRCWLATWVKTLYTRRLIINLLFSYTFEHVSCTSCIFNKVQCIVLSSYIWQSTFIDWGSINQNKVAPKFWVASLILHVSNRNKIKYQKGKIPSFICFVMPVVVRTCSVIY